MAIGYDNPGWTNGTAPALTGGVGGTLTALSDAVATLADAADSGASATVTKLYNDKNVGTNWPTAIVAALGTGWTTALAAAATSGSANKIDADTVSGYGIGTVAQALSTGYDLDTLKTDGLYSVSNPTGSASTVPPAGTYQILVMATSSSTVSQFIMSAGSEQTYCRSLVSGAWYLRKIWNAYSDGNGGQPPAPKPTASAVPGEWVATGVNAYTTPNVSGTYAVVAFKSGHYYSCKAGVVHNRDLNTEFSTTGIDAMVCWRTT